MNQKQLHDGEQVLKLLRQTKLILLPAAVVCFLLLYIPWLLMFRYDVGQPFRGIVFVFTIGVLGYFSREFVLWRRNKYAITNKRLIKYAHIGLFKKTVIETPIERVLNVSYKTTGLLSSTTRFGDVEVQVVGLIEPIVLKNVRYPEKIKDFLWDLHNKTGGGHSAQDTKPEDLQQQIGYTKQDQRIL